MIALVLHRFRDDDHALKLLGDVDYARHHLARWIVSRSNRWTVVS